MKLLTYILFYLLSLFLTINCIAQNYVTNTVNVPIDIIKTDNTIETVTHPVEVVRDGQSFEEINIDVSSIKVNSKKLRIKVNNLFYHTFTNSSVVVNPPTNNTGDTNTVVNPPTTNIGDTNVVVNPPTNPPPTDPPTVTPPPPTVVDNTIKTNNVVIDIELKLSTGQITTFTNFAAEVVENIQSGEITEILVDTTLLPQNAQILKIKLRDLLFDYARKNEDDNLVDPVDQNDGGADNNISPPSPPTDGVDNQSLNGPSVVQLPIEVLGKDQHTEEIKLVLNDNVSDVHGIKLQIHNLGFTNKMAISVNNSPWVNLNNTNVFFTKQFDKAMYGMGGGHNTLTFVVPFANNNIVPAITNIIKFKFNDRTKETVGYRVLDVDLVKAQPNGYELNFKHGTAEDPSWGVRTNYINKYTPAKLATVKTKEDPSKWIPISTDTAVINRGKDLWFNGNISERGIAINAKCTDCHTSDGYDLKYFNYSDKSIIARSKYHGLSDEDSNAIASYIRTLNVPYQEKGRPWNPPYQPGPGLDSKPVSSWAAGAGIEAVVDYDLQTYKALFPNGTDAGIKYDDGVGPINFNKSLNMREIPIVIQMPDWKDWLPRNHLKDVAPDIWDYISKTNGYRLPTYFANAINNHKPNDALWNLKNLYWGHGEAIAYSWIQMYQTAKLLEKYVENPTNTWMNIKIRNVIGPAWNHYVAVKHWEIMNKLGLQELGHEIYNPNNKDSWNNPLWKSYGGGIDPVEYQNKTGVAVTQGVQKRRWYDTLTFHLAPHIAGETTIYDMASPLWNQISWGPKSFMWYQIQMLLDDTNKTPSRNIIDWGYLFALSNVPKTHGTSSFDIFKIKSWAIHFLNGLKTDEAYALSAGVPNDKLPLEGRYYVPRGQSDLLGAEVQANDHRAGSDKWYTYLVFSAAFASASQNPEQRQAIMNASSKLIDAEIDFMDNFDGAYLIGQGLTKNQPDAWEAGIKYTGGDANVLNKVRNFRSRIWPDYVSTYSDSIKHVYPDTWPNLK